MVFKQPFHSTGCEIVHNKPLVHKGSETINFMPGNEIVTDKQHEKWAI
jgi:hypothetical protein